MRQDEEEEHSKGSKEDHREPACLERGVVLFNETGNTRPGGRSSVDFCFEILLNIQIQMSVRSARNSKVFHQAISNRFSHGSVSAYQLETLAFLKLLCHIKSFSFSHPLTNKYILSTLSTNYCSKHKWWCCWEEIKVSVHIEPTFQ